jgi:hypothetical protein
MNDAVLNELGDQSQQMYFKCPSDDNLSGLGLPADAAYPGATSMPLYQPDTNVPGAPDPLGTTYDPASVNQAPFDPNALQKLVSSPSSAYTNPGMGPNAGPQLTDGQRTMMTPWGPITPINNPSGFNPYALQTSVPPASASSGSGGWASTLIKAFDTTVKAGAPAATAYINYTAAQQALRNQPIQVPGGSRAPGGAAASYTPWIVGGLVVAGLLVALTVFSAKR